MLSAVSNEATEAVGIQLLLHISALHQCSPEWGNSDCHSNIRKERNSKLCLLPNANKLPFAKFRPGFVVLMLHQIASQIQPPRTKCRCQQEDFPVVLQVAPESCSTSTWAANIAVDYGQRVPLEHSKLLCHFYTQWQATALTAPLTCLVQAELFINQPSYLLKVTTFSTVSYAVLHLQIRKEWNWF